MRRGRSTILRPESRDLWCEVDGVTPRSLVLRPENGLFWNHCLATGIIPSQIMAAHMLDGEGSEEHKIGRLTNHTDTLSYRRV